MTMLETAERAESILHNAFSMKGDDFAFHIPEAMLVGIVTDGNGKLIDVNPEIASAGDIYDLLESVTPATVAKFTALGIVTCGWAAPMPENRDIADEDIPAPSQHKQRRRVRLFICANREGMASVLRFQDEPEETVTDSGEARGPLAEAIADLMNRV